MVCAFSGHRPEKLPWGGDERDARCAALKLQIFRAAEQAYRDGYSEFACGMARGCDLYFFDAVALLRAGFPDIRVTAWLPCPEQAARWNAADRARHEAALSQCDRIVTVEPAYSPGCMLRRNYYMVERSGLLIALYDGTPGGGTCNTLLYAIRRALDVIQLDPAQF